MRSGQGRKIGLARALSKLGYCSRSRAVDLIRAGRVSLNGTVRNDPETPVSEEFPRIAVDGTIVEEQEKIYVMLNKPRGVVTTASDEKGRATVYTVLKDSVPSTTSSVSAIPLWLAPVGRLDKASEGLLLLTNDSEWGARISAPETRLEKTYHVQIGTIADNDFAQALVRGVKAKDGELLRARQVRLLRSGQTNCWLEIILDRGKNRHIRRMMEVLGVEILRLVRVAIGPHPLGDLAKGTHRRLSAEEKRALDRAMGHET